MKFSYKTEMSLEVNQNQWQSHN